MELPAYNDLIKSTPEIFHWICSGIILASYSFLILAFKMVRSRIRPVIKWYLIASTSYIFYLFLGKFSSDSYTMLDAFLPMYVFHFISSLLILQARFFNCIKNGRFGLFDFNSFSKNENHE
jgi:hypothetical protein